MSAPVQPVERLERVLDTATDLLVRWGYQRVTIDEVARRAGIGKGTVYLHFRTKEALFLAVLLRAHHGVLEGITARMETDAEEALPARMVRSLYLALAGDPVIRPLYLGDSEVLGRLAHEAGASLGELGRRREEVGRTWFGLLRDAGLLRTDLDVDAQMYAFSAVTSGFLFVDSLPVSGWRTDPQARADLLEHTVAAALQVPGAHDAAAAVAPAVAALFRPLTEHVDTEWRRRVR